MYFLAKFVEYYRKDAVLDEKVVFSNDYYFFMVSIVLRSLEFVCLIEFTFYPFGEFRKTLDGA